MLTHLKNHTGLSGLQIAGLIAAYLLIMALVLAGGTFIVLYVWRAVMG